MSDPKPSLQHETKERNEGRESVHSRNLNTHFSNWHLNVRTTFWKFNSFAASTNYIFFGASNESKGQNKNLQNVKCNTSVPLIEVSQGGVGFHNDVDIHMTFMVEKISVPKMPQHAAVHGITGGSNHSSFLSQPTLTNSSSFFFTRGQQSFRYFSLYFGNNVANELSASMPCGLSSLEMPGSFHPSGTVNNSSSFSFFFSEKVGQTTEVVWDTMQPTTLFCGEADATNQPFTSKKSHTRLGSNSGVGLWFPSNCLAAAVGVTQKQWGVSIRLSTRKY